VRDAWADEGEKLAKSCDMSAWIYALFCVTSILISTKKKKQEPLKIMKRLLNTQHISKWRLIINTNFLHKDSNPTRHITVGLIV